jgi:hypothetical protein
MRNGHVKNKLRNPLIVLAVSALLCVGDRRTEGFSFYQLDGVNIIWVGGQSTRCLSPSTFPPGSETEALILGAMGAWNMTPSCDFEYSYLPLDQDYPIDHYDGYNDTAAVPADQLDPGVLGVTYMVNDGAQWFDMDMLFSASPGGVGYNFDFFPSCEVVRSPFPNNGFSFLLMATHELGHALGLGHDPIGNEAPGTVWFAANMNPGYPAGGTFGQENIVELHADDRSGVRFLYPHSGPSDPPFVDLALSGYASSGSLGTAVPLPLAPLSVYPGEQIIVRSVIENLGTTSELFVQQGFYLSNDEFIDVADELLGYLTWDVAFGDALEFDALIDLPQDMSAGTYAVGAILDDLQEVAEVFEDNNAAACCDLLTVNQLAPVIGQMDQQVVPCGQPYIGVPPTVTHPLNMSPITWSLDNPEPGMTIDSVTGVIRWNNPVPSPFLYTLRVRATNAAGTSMEILFLGVAASAPQIVPIANESIACHSRYTGPVPVLTSPACMSPILNWSLDEGPAGMDIDHDTGVVSWSVPIPSPVAYAVTIRGTNAVGNGTESWTLRVVPGDLNGDGVVTLGDAARFAECLGGPAGTVLPGCECADADLDGNVDLADFRAFQEQFGN